MIKCIGFTSSAMAGTCSAELFLKVVEVLNVFEAIVRYLGLNK